VLIGGLRYSCGSPGGRRRIIALSFLPSVLIAVTQSAKWPFLLSIVLFFGGVLVYRLLSGKLHLIDRDARKAMVMYGSVVLLIVTVSFASRGVYAADDFNIWPMMLSKFASYTSGHLYAFSDWFAFSLGRPSEWTYDREPASHGFYTFATLFKLMGSSRVLPIGVYDDDYAYAGLIVSNVFTMFRGAIIDFGYAGALVLMAAVGALFHGAFHALLVIRRPVFAVVAFLFMMGFLYSSFVVSLFGSNIVYYVTFALLWVTLWVNQRVAGARAHPPPAYP
jgi:oligosaccharide repeat unit polymerase